MIDQHYTVEQVAAKLSIRPRAIREYLNAGKIKGIKIERSWRISETALDDFIAERTMMKYVENQNEPRKK